MYKYYYKLANQKLINRINLIEYRVEIEKIIRDNFYSSGMQIEVFQEHFIIKTWIDIVRNLSRIIKKLSSEGELAQIGDLFPPTGKSKNLFRRFKTEKSEYVNNSDAEIVNYVRFLPPNNILPNLVEHEQLIDKYMEQYKDKIPFHYVHHRGVEIFYIQKKGENPDIQYIFETLFIIVAIYEKVRSGRILDIK